MVGTEVTTEAGAATVALSGEFEMAGTFTIEPVLERLLALPGLAQVTLDLSAVSFIDSVGLGVVIRFAHELDLLAIPLRIVPGPREVQRVFASAGLADALPFEPRPAA